MSSTHQLVIRLHVLAAGHVLAPQPRPVVEVAVVRPAAGVLLLGQLGRRVLGVRHALTQTLVLLRVALGLAAQRRHVALGQLILGASAAPRALRVGQVHHACAIAVNGDWRKFSQCFENHC